jgi:hypothetical protein
MFDSCGIFAGSRVARAKMHFDPAVAGGGQVASKLAMFVRGQGYPIQSYKGKQAALDETCRPIEVQPDDAELRVPRGPGHSADAWAVDFRTRQMLPTCKQKLVTQRWDRGVALFTGGAHMPLMVFIHSGDGSRSAQAKDARYRKRSQSLANRRPKGKGNGKGKAKGPAVAERPAVAGGLAVAGRPFVAENPAVAGGLADKGTGKGADAAVAAVPYHATGLPAPQMPMRVETLPRPLPVFAGVPPPPPRQPPQGVPPPPARPPPR